MDAQATVLYFAALRDAAGVASECVAADGDLGALYDGLRARHGFRWTRSQLRVAVDGAFAPWDQALRAGTEIAFIPPVSGGQVPRFALSDRPLDVAGLRADLLDARVGAYAAFEGWVRDHNAGRPVAGLHYEAYERLAVAEGTRVVEEALAKFDIVDAACVHRTGDLAIGELAVWVGVTAAHRDAAFAACRHVIDEVKARVPIWKRERYGAGDAGWLHPEA